MRYTFRFAAGFALAIGAIGAATPTTPTFFARRDYPGLYSYCVQVADTNGDGIPDLISERPGAIKVMFGNGDGTFRPGPTDTSLGGIYSFVAADFNGDGKPDLALATGNSIIVALGNGDGTFQPGLAYPLSDDVFIPIAADLNGDGILDIAAAGYTGIWLLTGTASGTFNAPVLAVALAGTYNLAAADFNQDGKPDLVATTPFAPGGKVGGAGVAVLLGNGDGTFQTPEILTPPSFSTALAVGALTKGGPPSIVVGSSTAGALYIFPGNGAGGFSASLQFTLPGAGLNGLAMGDLNGDGIGDLISETGYVAYGKGGGAFTTPIGYPIALGDQVDGVTLADLRNNGQTDIVTAGYFTVSVLLNEGQGYIEDGIWTAVSGGAKCGVAGDFNGDGKPDLAVNNSSGISILLGTGKYLTPYSAGTSIAQPGAGCLVTGDLNGDGKPDLLVPVNGTVAAYLGNGDGTFTLASATPTPSGGSLALGDFNHDGKLDFATSGNLLALGNGDGTFQAPTGIVSNPPANGFSSIAAGDINNDGWTDLILLTVNFPAATSPVVLVNNQQGGFTSIATSLQTIASQLILADLNGDGNLDLVLGGYHGGGALICLGNGQGAFSSTATLASAPGGESGINLVADVNGDGIPDVLVSEENTIAVYLGEGGAAYAPAFAMGGGPAPGSLLTANLHGQSPTAGVPDIVAPDVSGGVMVLFNLTP